MRLTFALTSCTAALALGACTTGPDYAAPAPPPSAVGSFLQGSAAVAAVDPGSGRWWKLYGDPVLDRLVADALASNTDVRVAIARLSRARATLREAGSDRLPTTDLSAGVNRQRSSAIQTLPGFDRENTVVNGGVSVAYEVDLFGRVRRNVEAAQGDVGAARADVEAVRVAVAADTTRAYVDAASSASRMAVAERVVALLDRSLKVASGRERAGLTTPLDTARIGALREQRRSDVPVLAAERQAALMRLAILTGRTPRDLPPEAGAISVPPSLRQPIPVGDGAALLARRPDVRAAERRLAAATARIGVTTAELYPRISLGASIGTTGNGFGDLLGAGPLRWLVGPLISWAFPNQARTRARIAAASSDAEAALATFDGTVLQALSETETALSTYARSLDQRTALAASRQQAERAVRIVRAQQREGQVDSLSLLDAERTFADADAQLADADARIADAQVDLFRALGGGWQDPTA